MSEFYFLLRFNQIVCLCEFVDLHILSVVYVRLIIVRIRQRNTKLSQDLQLLMYTTRTLNLELQ